MSQGPEQVEYPWPPPTCFNPCKREGARFMLQGTYAKLNPYNQGSNASLSVL